MRAETAGSPSRKAARCGLLATAIVALLASASGCRREGTTTATATAATTPTSAAPSTSASPVPKTSYRDEAGRFEIAMPGKATIEEHETKVAGPRHMASVKVDEVTYFAMWFDFPVRVAVNVPGAFDGAQNNTCKQDDVTVTSSRDLKFEGGAPERDVVAESTSGKHWKDEMRFVFVAPRLYTLLVRGVVDEGRAQAYLQSFRLLPSTASSDATWTLGTLGPATASFPAAPKEAKSMQQGSEGPVEVRTLRLTRAASTWAFSSPSIRSRDPKRMPTWRRVSTVCETR